MTRNENQPRSLYQNEVCLIVPVTGKIYKYQERELRKLGFYPTRNFHNRAEIAATKIYFNGRTAADDKANITAAYNILNAKRPAWMAVIKEAQFARGAQLFCDMPTRKQAQSWRDYIL